MLLRGCVYTQTTKVDATQDQHTLMIKGCWKYSLWMFHKALVIQSH